ncbi:MAG: hypothetical protein U1V55_22720 [Planktothrix rubescens PR222]
MPEIKGCEQSPQVVFLWGVPRSASTAFEKCMSQNTQVEIEHEPFTNDYYFSQKRRSNRYGDNQNLIDYDGNNLIKLKLDICKKKILFIKELAFQGLHFISDEILASSRNAFIINNPTNVINSLHKLKPDFTEEEFGYIPIKVIFDKVTQELNHKPIVINTIRFRQNPDLILNKFCEEIGIKFHGSMLHWDNGKLREWKNHESESQSKWHKTLEKSNTIIPWVNIKDNPVFISKEKEFEFINAIEIYEALSLFQL